MDRIYPDDSGNDRAVRVVEGIGFHGIIGIESGLKFEWIRLGVGMLSRRQGVQRGGKEAI